MTDKCKRCGADEFRINGYCSCACEDMHEVEQERDSLRSQLAEAQAEVERYKAAWDCDGKTHGPWCREWKRMEAEVGRLRKLVADTEEINARDELTDPDYAATHNWRENVALRAEIGRLRGVKESAEAWRAELVVHSRITDEDEELAAQCVMLDAILLGHKPGEGG